ncbi:MAG: GGDEF domain-containing protein [Rhizobiaceae bacterium]|nr:GGDEF domain-containing protein [Rhizobiaceae bacterium]
MDRQLDSMRRLWLETSGLMLAMGAVIVIGAYHYFDGFGFESARSALAFSLGALLASAIPVQLYVVFRLASLKAENLSLFDRATRDGLTRVLNRTTFKSAVETEIESLGRRKADGASFTLLIVDADHFKRINDRLGHATGDQALVAIASTLQRSVRKDDLVGRIGGEEFGILLRNAGFGEAQIVADRLRLAIHELTVGPRREPVRLSVSMGGVTFANAMPYDTLYRAADANLYRAKKNGRNRVDLVNLVRMIRRDGDNRGATGALTRDMAGAVLRDVPERKAG